MEKKWKFVIFYFLKSHSESVLKLNLDMKKTLSLAESFYSPKNPSVKYYSTESLLERKKIQYLEVPL